MEHKIIRSSNLETGAYDPATRRLEIRFKGGATYEYYDVPAADAAAVLEAEDKAGAIFAERIRGRDRDRPLYAFKKLSP